MRRTALALAFALAWSAVARSEPSAELQAKMTGTFRLAESEDTVKERLAAAIERAIEPMSFIVRPIARSRLHRPVYYCKQYRLALDAAAVHVTCDDRPRIDRRLDNSEGRITGLDDEPLDVHVSTAADSVQMTFASSDGKRTTTYRFGDAGALEVNVKIESESLERPVAWKVHYRRAQ
jgi:DNA-binding LytR/AlgR family response regulator